MESGSLQRVRLSCYFFLPLSLPPPPLLGEHVKPRLFALLEALWDRGLVGLLLPGPQLHAQWALRGPLLFHFCTSSFYSTPITHLAFLFSPFPWVYLDVPSRSYIALLNCCFLGYTGTNHLLYASLSLAHAGCKLSPVARRVVPLLAAFAISLTFHFVSCVVSPGCRLSPGRPLGWKAYACRWVFIAPTFPF